ncbi:MAG: hypothetical protein ABL918_05160 [Chakrabartia sp.]
MRIRLTLAAATCAMAVLTFAIPAQARINQRQNHQQHRIAAGISNGSLTAHEVARLERQQVQIAQLEARSRADGGGLSPAERARIEAKQDRASANIRHQKHDAQGR